MALINEGVAQAGQAIFAHEQVAGRGQRGNTWQTIGGQNITISLLINPSLIRISGQPATSPNPASQFLLSATTALGTLDFFENFTNGDCSLKWPNDLYWRDRKAGGILIENQIRPNLGWLWAVAGIGININQTDFPPELPNPVSLKQITGKNYDPLTLAQNLCEKITIRFHQAQNSGPDIILTDYNKHLYKKGETVKIRKDNRLFEATIIAVNPFGQLEVLLGDRRESLDWPAELVDR